MTCKNGLFLEDETKNVQTKVMTGKKMLMMIVTWKPSLVRNCSHAQRERKC